jgi:hypothetical protein
MLALPKLPSDSRVRACWALGLILIASLFPGLLYSSQVFELIETTKFESLNNASLRANESSPESINFPTPGPNISVTTTAIATYLSGTEFPKIRDFIGSCFAAYLESYYSPCHVTWESFLLLSF